MFGLTSPLVEVWETRGSLGASWTIDRDAQVKVQRNFEAGRSTSGIPLL